MNISVAGVARRNGKYLVALRKPGTSIGERWEFPGGKMEGDESPEQALVREFMEELSVKVEVNEKLCEGSFSNGEKNYKLIAYRINLLSDNFSTSEHQKIIWADAGELERLDFPESDMIIVNHLLSA